MKFLLELKDFFRFFWRTGKKDKEIVFYSEHGGYYPNYAGIIEELISRQKTICYITSDFNDPIRENRTPAIKTFYLNKLLPFLMIFINCKVFVMTLSDLHQYHLKRSINQVHYLYIFHSMVSTHMMYLPGAFDYYDTILCVGPFQVEEIRAWEKRHKLPEKRLVKGGYYRLEKIHRQSTQFKQNNPASSSKPIVLIAPSWGKMNILESCGEKLVELLLSANYNVIVRTHPETVKRTPQMLDHLAGKFNQHPDFTLERSIATNDSLLKADVMICDCSGVALEYALGTERPVLFLDVPRKIRNQNFQDLGIEPFELSIREQIGTVVPPRELDSIPKEIDKLIAGQKEYQQHITELRRQYIFCFNQSARVGAEEIINIANW